MKEAWQPRTGPPEAAAGRPYAPTISLAPLYFNILNDCRSRDPGRQQPVRLPAVPWPAGADNREDGSPLGNQTKAPTFGFKIQP